MQKVNPTLENELKEYLNKLDIKVLQMDFVPLGEESYSWKIETEAETLFLKYCTKGKIIRNLNKINSLLFSLQDYEFIVPPILIKGKTEQPFRDGYIYASKYIVGKVQAMRTLEIPNRIIEEINEIMTQIHKTEVIIDSFPQEDFNYNFRKEYTEILNDIDKGKDISELNSKDLNKVNDMIIKFEEMSSGILKNPPQMVLTHGDITGRNIIEVEDSSIKLLDWDETEIAPKERDINFINGHPGFDMEVYKKITGSEDIDQSLIAYYALVWSLESIMENAKKLQNHREEYGTREYLMEDITDSLNNY